MPERLNKPCFIISSYNMLQLYIYELNMLLMFYLVRVTAFVVNVFL